MARWILLYLGLSLTLALAACAPPLGPQESCNFVQNSLQRRVSWPATPLAIGIENTFPADFRVSLEEAMQWWEVAAGRQLFNRSIRVIDRSQVDNVNISLLWNETWTNSPNQQATTLIQFRSDSIYRAIIYFNAKDHRFSVFEEPGAVHMKSLMIHELGHALGLDHINDRESVMYPSLANNTVRTKLSEVDKMSLGCEY